MNKTPSTVGGFLKEIKSVEKTLLMEIPESMMDGDLVNETNNIKKEIRIFLNLYLIHITDIAGENATEDEVTKIVNDVAEIEIGDFYEIVSRKLKIDTVIDVE